MTSDFIKINLIMFTLYNYIFKEHTTSNLNIKVNS